MGARWSGGAKEIASAAVSAIDAATSSSADAKACDARVHVMFMGTHGSGKTALFTQLCHLLGAPNFDRGITALQMRRNLVDVRTSVGCQANTVRCRACSA